MTKSFDSNPYFAQSDASSASSVEWRQLYATQALGLETARLADAQETANMLKVLEMRFTAVHIGKPSNDVLADKILARMGL